MLLCCCAYRVLEKYQQKRSSSLSFISKVKNLSLSLQFGHDRKKDNANERKKREGGNSLHFDKHGNLKKKKSTQSKEIKHNDVLESSWKNER